MAPHKVILLESIHPQALELLQNTPQVAVELAYEAPVAETDWQQASVVITRGIGKVDAALLAKCPQLKIAARCGVGLDNFDLPACAQAGVRVINAPGSNAQTVAEHTLALMLMLQRNMYKAITEAKAGHWAIRSSLATDELYQKHLGIIGMGHVAQKLAPMAQALGMKVSYWSRTRQPVPYDYLALPELLAQSHVISLHIALDDSTQGIIGKQALDTMQPGTLLINTARAQLIDTNALLQALDKHLGGYAADVPMSIPPPATDPLLSHPKVLITPHNSSLTANTYRHICLVTVQQVVAALETW